MGQVARIRLNSHMRVPVAALCGSLVLLAGAGLIEKAHYVQSARVEQSYRQRFELSEARLRAVNILYRHVLAIAALDSEIRSITDSGDADARRLEDIANKMPSHTWLTAITHDANGVVLDGKTRDLGSLSDLLRGLMRLRRASNPVLRSAVVTDGSPKTTAVAYELHLDTAP